LDILPGNAGFFVPEMSAIVAVFYFELRHECAIKAKGFFKVT